MKKKWIRGLLLAALAMLSANSVNAASIDTSLYTQLKAPDYSELELTIDNQEPCEYTMDACDGRIYIAGDTLTITHNGKESPVVLIYDETTNSWSTIWATFLDTEGDLEIIAGDDMLYFFNDDPSALTVYSYDLKSKAVKTLSSIVSSERTLTEEEKAALAGVEAKPQEQLAQMLTEAKEVLKEGENPNLVGTISGEYFYVFGDKTGAEEMTNIFYRFTVTGEDALEIIVEEPAKADSDSKDAAAEDTKLPEESNENQDFITKLIVVFCMAILLSSAALKLFHYKTKNSDSDKSEEE